ncbi:MAG: Transcriptional regulator SlyA [Pelotomaculum sp. PtaB.Bin013]|uniref:MarR family transcriptional regulator n=1 Tax=Pelotomaculum isophthalicicum JI TaxID=947010 RepID=A0A9X4JTH9_9FIRM|nr:MarR family transcriptional regulator [Pelotomaculum isophthalicicum]MDF9408799.1 MarR family transcriptional regulator [Pelotomaculum isophthalicicum JI]OPX91296.1 MAG: Transcriptional regulator SlyA [Pelotomaculum sp. PtaB.Bin013]
MCRNLKPYDITPEQWGLINILFRKDGISQKELSEKSFKDQPTITRILDNLEAKGMIERKINREDRRTFMIFLTNEGRDLRDKLLPIAEKTLQKVLTGFKEEEIEQLKIWLNKIYNNLI